VQGAQQAAVPGCIDRAGSKTGHNKKGSGVEHKVAEVRERMIGGKMPSSKLERLLNESARHG
jgi:hypothetical protein